MDKRNRLEEIIAGFQNVRIAVLGDLVADVFIYGQTSRVSREAPVLVLEYKSEKLVLGGGANAINNVRSLGASAIPIGIVGPDESGRKLCETLKANGIGTEFVLKVPGRVTTTKQRIAGSALHTTHQQILRVDRGQREPVGAEAEKKLIAALDAACALADILIASDYDYGVLTPAMITRVNQIAAQGRVKVMVDSRYRMTQFRNAYVMTPNEPEAQDASGIVFRSIDDVRSAGKTLLDITQAQALLITRGRQGMALFESTGSETHIPIFGTDEIADVTGAGDTVIATFAAATGAGANLIEAAVLSNVAGGLVVMKSGTATVSASELIDAIHREDPWPAS